MEGATSTSRTCTVLSVPGTLQGQAEPSQARPGLARTMAAAGLGVAPVPCSFHLWKLLEQTITETVKRISICISSYCKGGLEQKKSRQAACLLLGVSASSDKDKIRAADRISRILKHPDKGGSP
ncbi:DJC15 protein, partial [Notiomystis cincta]|nr:DJC15 protein [Notiomystis cincta]